MTQISDCFGKVRGQERLVSILTKAAMAVANGSKCTNALLTSPAGCGKSFLADCYAKAVITAWESRGKNPVYLNYQSINRLRLIGPDYGQFRDLLETTRPVVIVFDELQSFSVSPTRQTQKIYQFLKEFTDGARWENNKKVIPFDEDLTIECDDREICFICATNFLTKIPDREAMTSRLLHVQIDPLSDEIAGLILEQMLKDSGLSVNTTTNDFELIRKVARGSARSLERIRDYFLMDNAAMGKRSKTINREQILVAMRDLRLYPNGLTESECAMLNIIPLKSHAKGPKIKGLAYILGREPKEMQESFAYLNIKGFVNGEITNVSATKLGKQFLRVLHENGFNWKFKNPEQFKEKSVISLD